MVDNCRLNTKKPPVYAAHEARAYGLQEAPLTLCYLVSDTARMAAHAMLYSIPLSALHVARILWRLSCLQRQIPVARITDSCPNSGTSFENQLHNPAAITQ